MTQLSGTQIGDLVEALLHAYPSEADLAMMVKIELDQTLAAIAMGSNLRVIAFNLVAWADRSGYVDELVAGAVKQNPRNPALQAYLKRWPAAEPPTPSIPAALAKPGPAAIDVFLSYSRQNLDAMRTVEAGLRGAGLSVWTDEGLEAGTPSWTAAIEEAVGQAQVMVVLLSPAAKASQWVEREVALAETLGKRIFPVLVEGDVRSAVPFRLISVQWVDGRPALGQAVQQTQAAVLAHLSHPPAEARSVRPQASEISNAAMSEENSLRASAESGNGQQPVAFDWVLIPAGEFLMGSDQDLNQNARDDELPQHRVYLDAFHIARVPVTNAQYAVFVNETDYRAPQHWTDGTIPPGLGNHPVRYVSWDDAQAFCQWASVCLPTEAQWEKAARGTDGRIYPWGNTPPARTLTNVRLAAGSHHVDGTTAVTDYLEGASPYGVLDMVGNVWEWVADWYAYRYYAHSPVRNPTGPTEGHFRILRGGSWDEPAAEVSASVRLRYDPGGDFYGHAGFRVAMCAS